MRVRQFSIPSDAITFASGVATVTFSQLTGPGKRCAIVGIAYDADDPQDALLCRITDFRVGNRQYVQGDGVMLGLLAPGAEPAGTGSQNGWTSQPYFPCSKRTNEHGVMAGHGIPMPGGGYAGGILLNGQERITMALAEVSSGNNPINRVVLQCVQFDDPPGNKDRKSGNLTEDQLETETFWDEFSRGIGQLHFHGTNQTYANGAVLSNQVDQTIHSPYQSRVRRLEIRGLTTTTTAVAEDNFADLSVICGTDTQPGNQRAAVPARTAMGHAHLRFPGLLAVDLEDGGRNLVDVTGPDPGAAMVNRFCAIFEGQSEDAEFLCGPTPF